jgi:hypothetical protein
MPRYFKLHECEAVLPKVEQALRDALAHRAEYRKADEEIDASMKHIRESGGARVDRSAYLSTRARRDAAAAAVQDAMDRVERFGALVKDLEIGLIDFLTVYDGQEVYLCWKLGEDRIRFWHGLTEGYRGRKPIDEEFIENHGAEEDDPN